MRYKFMFTISSTKKTVTIWHQNDKEYKNILEATDDFVDRIKRIHNQFEIKSILPGKIDTSDGKNDCLFHIERLN